MTVPSDLDVSVLREVRAFPADRRDEYRLDDRESLDGRAVAGCEGRTVAGREGRTVAGRGGRAVERGTETAPDLRLPDGRLCVRDAERRWAVRDGLTRAAGRCTLLLFRTRAGDL